jgi:CDP-6-deoxy-D-xylo-4-hexulose-3-dehydrase
MVQERKGVAMRWPLMGETITYMDRLKMAYFTLTAKKFTFGEKVEQFENEWSEWLGAKHSLFVSSGSTANFLLIAAVKELYGLKNGDKVLVPACTWMTNVAPIMQLGLEPVFCDINLYNFSFDLAEAKNIALKHDIKLVFITHLLGFSADN